MEHAHALGEFELWRTQRDERVYKKPFTVSNFEHLREIVANRTNLIYYAFAAHTPHNLE